MSGTRKELAEDDTFSSDLEILRSCALSMQRKQLKPIVELQVYTLAGLICIVRAERTWDLAHVMEAIEKASGVPAREQNLLVGTDSLSSQAPLISFSNRSAVQLTLIRRQMQERPPSPRYSTVSSCLEDDSYSCFS
mmetsp:Transcript_52894/g.113394  ORF Transcript_52894/g.113394 Transcript_52894/m.113394 type:complete len:136 (+) Transcript_52894:78-485(+)